MKTRRNLIQAISERGADELLRPLDFVKIALPGTIYNIFSDLVASGELRRVARGVYTRGTRDFTAGEIAIVKATANNRHITALHTLSKDGLPFHIFSSDGRSTSFQLLEKGMTTGVVFFLELKGNSHKRKDRTPVSVAACSTNKHTDEKHPESPPSGSESSTKPRNSTKLHKNTPVHSGRHNNHKTALVGMLKSLSECLRQQELLLRRMLQAVEAIGFP